MKSFKLFLTEAMKQPDQLQGKIVVIDENDPERIYLKIVSSKDKKKYMTSGMIMKCPDKTPYWTCHQSASEFYKNQGYGPLLYDIAIEYVSQKGKDSGIVPASGFNCGLNTADSSRVWKYYYDNRSDVSKTKIPEQFQHLINVDAEPWLQTVYRKDNPIIINRLMALNKLTHGKF